LAIRGTPVFHPVDSIFPHTGSDIGTHLQIIVCQDAEVANCHISSLIGIIELKVQGWHSDHLWTSLAESGRGAASWNTVGVTGTHIYRIGAVPAIFQHRFV